MVANVGSVELLPGAPNVIPGQASLTAEFRAPSMETLDRAAAELISLARRIAAEEGCSATSQRISRKPVTWFDACMRDLIEQSCQETGHPVGRLVSYAGHDASVIGGCVPSGMIFVPSSGGISHAPEESTPTQLLVLGCQALLSAVVQVHLSSL
jgi:N-carbamoyl-L-amino-acid hydrolase